MTPLIVHAHRAVLFLAAGDKKKKADDKGGIIPKFTPSVPGALQTPTGTILGWAAGCGLAMAVLGGLTGWACVAIGHNSERASLAARGKTGIVWSLISGVGIAVTSGLVMAFYSMATSS